MKILIAEDDAISRRLLETILRKWGYDVVVAQDGGQAWTELQKEDAPRLAILDWMMPEMDGVEVCGKVRDRIGSPYVYILLLSAKSQREDLVKGMESGADDYITKPFDPDELSARVAAVLRRTRGDAPPHDELLDYGNLVIDLSNRRVLVNGVEAQLSKTEWEVLAQLAAHPGRVMPHGALLARIWGPEFRDETYYLRTWISRIRKKLGERADGTPLITTFAGVGYRLEPPPAPTTT